MDDITKITSRADAMEQSYAAVKNAVNQLQQRLDRLEQGHKLTIIFPKDEEVTLPDISRGELKDSLIPQYLSDPTAYSGLYATDTSLNFDAVARLFAQRTWSRAI